MNIPLTEAPMGRPLVLTAVKDMDLARRLRLMGLFEGSEIMRLDEEVMLRPVRIRGPKGEAVLGGGMAAKVVVHLDDGRKMPLSEMKGGETGHMEGLTGGRDLADTLEILGLTLNDHIHFVRALPPMEYITIIENRGRVRLTEGMASKIWGEMLGQTLQFVSARAGEKFRVIKLLGGNRARRQLRSKGLEPGKILILEGVAQAQSLNPGLFNPVIVSSREGLRLFLGIDEGDKVLVREIEK